VTIIVTWRDDRGGPVQRRFAPHDLAAALDFALTKRRQFRGRRRVIIGALDNEG
jgi:hypothetical protein